MKGKGASGGREISCVSLESDFFLVKKTKQDFLTAIAKSPISSPTCIFWLHFSQLHFAFQPTSSILNIPLLTLPPPKKIFFPVLKHTRTKRGRKDKIPHQTLVIHSLAWNQDKYCFTAAPLNTRVRIQSGIFLDYYILEIFQSTQVVLWLSLRLNFEEIMSCTQLKPDLLQQRRNGWLCIHNCVHARLQKWNTYVSPIITESKMV